MKQNSLLDQLRRVLSILLNLAVVRMEPIAIRMSWEAVGEQSLTFYTENSNLFSAAVCLLVAVCQLWALLSGRALPRWVKRLKFIAACCLTLTFLTVVFVLAPCYPDEGGVVFLLTESSMLYHHLLNPVLVFVSFVFLEREPGPEHPAGAGADGDLRKHRSVGQLPASVDGALPLFAGV